VTGSKTKKESGEQIKMYVLWTMVALLGLYFIRALRGPSIWDRLLAMNLIATKIIVIIIAYASVEDSAFLIDFAIIYALSGFIGTVFIALFLSERRLGKRRAGNGNNQRENDK